jgi:two-component system response regulator VanR
VSIKNIDCLIVEDESDIRDLMADYCKEISTFRLISTAADGVEAMLKLQNQKFQLIIVNVNLPKKNGLKIIKDLKNENSLNVKSDIILLSGDLKPGQLEEAISLGIKNFIFKPFNQASFTKKILSIIKKY